MAKPQHPKIYPIVHIDRLATIVQIGLLSDTRVLEQHQNSQAYKKVCDAGELKPGEKDIEKTIYQWNARKRQFTPRQISLAAQVLSAL